MATSINDGQDQDDDVSSLLSGAGQDVSSDIDSDDDGNSQDSQQSSSIAAQQAAKAIEAAQERGSSSSSPSIAATSRPASLAPSSAASSFWYHPPQRNRRTSSPGPPGYAEAITQSAFVPSGQRASAAGYSDDDEASGEILADGLPSKDRSCRRLWKRLLLLNVTIYCIAITAVLLFKWAMVGKERISVQAKPSWALAESFHKNTSECSFDTSAGFKYFSWQSPEDFVFVEEMQPLRESGDRSIRLSGRVEIRPAPYNQESSIEVITSASTSSGWTAGSPHFEYDSNGLRLTLSQSAPPANHGHGDLKRRDGSSIQCLDIFVGIYVRNPPPNWNIETESMDIVVGRSHSRQGFRLSELRVGGETRISSQRGNIDIFRLDSCHAYISSQHGTIVGEFSMREELHLHSETNDISAKVDRQSVSSHEAQNQPQANFTTTSGSGNQYITLSQSPTGQIWIGSGYQHTYPIHSQHISRSGAIMMQTNSFWEGNVTVSTVDGDIELRGTNLTQALNEPSRKTKHATKGIEASSMIVETESGGIDVCIDDYLRCVTLQEEFGK